MDQYKDFTIETAKFGDQAAMVNTLHGMGMHYVMIVVCTYFFVKSICCWLLFSQEFLHQKSNFEQVSF